MAGLSDEGEKRGLSPFLFPGLAVWCFKLMSADSMPCAATEDNSFAVCLRVTLLIQCLGLCMALQKADLPLRIWLDRYLGSSLLVQLLVVVTAVSAITILYRPMRVVVIGLGILLLVNFFSEAAMSTSLELLLKPFSHSARYLIPFALLLLPKSMSAAVWLMRVAAAATFLRTRYPGAGPVAALYRADSELRRAVVGVIHLAGGGRQDAAGDRHDRPRPGHRNRARQVAFCLRVHVRLGCSYRCQPDGAFWVDRHPRNTDAGSQCRRTSGALPALAPETRNERPGTKLESRMNLNRPNTLDPAAS